MAPYHWIKQIESALEETGAIPLWGSPPPFPWEEFMQHLKKALHLEKFSFSLKKTGWHGENEVLAGFGHSLNVLNLELSPLPGAFYWVMAQDDVGRLTAEALSPQKPAKGFSDPRFQEGFYRYIALEALHLSDQLRAFDDLSLKLSSPSSVPKLGALCMDIEIECNHQTLWGRVICPEAFHSSFKTHFAQKRPALLESRLAQEIEATVRLEIGNATLSIDDWKRVRPGDFILLDRCTYDPKLEKGSASVVLGKTPLFQARLKHDSIKIIDYAFYYEENKMIDDSIPGEDEEKEDYLDEEPLSEGDLEEVGGEENSNHLWSPKEGQDASLEKMVSANEIPIILTVEVARLRMTIEKLMELKPGNTLELSTRPEQGVDLSINGKRVAKGELIKIGEALGVKILHIAE